MIKEKRFVSLVILWSTVIFLGSGVAFSMGVIYAPLMIEQDMNGENIAQRMSSFSPDFSYAHKCGASQLLVTGEDNKFKNAVSDAESFYPGRIVIETIDFDRKLIEINKKFSSAI